MHKGPGKFELILNLKEVIVLFFVMVTLFTGLLFFGYRVGYKRSVSATQVPARPVAPAQQSPQTEQEAPAVEVEPEFRLENSPERPSGEPFGAAQPDDPAASSPKPLAWDLAERPARPCMAGVYVAYQQKTLPAKHRFVERLGDWVDAFALQNGARSGQERTQEIESAAGSETSAFQARLPQAPDCRPPAIPQVSSSVAC
jgi:hypothetical protein